MLESDGESFMWLLSWIRFFVGVSSAVCVLAILAMVDGGLPRQILVVVKSLVFSGAAVFGLGMACFVRSAYRNLKEDHKDKSVNYSISIWRATSILLLLVPPVVCAVAFLL